MKQYYIYEGPLLPYEIDKFDKDKFLFFKINDINYCMFESCYLFNFSFYDKENSKIQLLDEDFEFIFPAKKLYITSIYNDTETETETKDHHKVIPFIGNLNSLLRVYYPLECYGICNLNESQIMYIKLLQ